MFKAWIEMYRRSARYALLCPWLFAVPLAMEMIQHAVEVHVGMYDSLASAIAIEHHPARMILGHIKIVTLFLTGYWAMRFFLHGDDPAQAARWDPAAIRTFARVLAWGLFWLLVIQDGPMLAAALGISDKLVGRTVVTLLLADMLFETCLSAWKAAAAVGNDRIGFFRSIAMVRGSYWWGTGLLVTGMLPLMVAHYALAALAMGKTGALLWTILAADSLLTAFLGVITIALTFVTARRMADRHGETLLPASMPRRPAADLATL
jgi:hypothetical protein